jgi:hypothetical protein
MWKKLLEYFRTYLFLAHDVQQNRKDIIELQGGVRDLTELVKALQYEIRSLREEMAYDREMQALRLENAFLKFERLLPPPGRRKRK